jgi:hypothetical protein
VPSEQRYEALAANAQLTDPIDTRPANISLAKILIVAHPLFDRHDSVFA